MKKIPPILTRALLMAASGFLLSIPAGKYAVSRQESFQALDDAGKWAAHAGPVPIAKEEGTAQTAERLAGQLKQIGAHISEAARFFSPRQQIFVQPSVLEYNLMKLYPEDASFLGETVPPNLDLSRLEQFLSGLNPDSPLLASFDGLRSYGIQMYERLSKKDIQWLARIYQWIQSTPEQAAMRLGVENTAILGSFDPTNPKHDPDWPGTWTIRSWKNITFQFIDGDGRRISLHSNAAEILSMASVYTYYQDWTDVELFEAYIDRLWEDSHQFRIKMGEVYYCDGCTALPERKAAFRTEGETGLQKEDKTGSREEEETGLQEEGETGSREEEETGLQEEEETGSREEDKTGSREEAQTGKEEEAASRMAPQRQTEGEDSEEAGSKTNIAAAGPASPSELSDGSASTASPPAAFSSRQDAEDEETAWDLEEALAAALAASPESGAVRVNEEGRFCPGHVDLTIIGLISGFSGQYSLFNLDQMGNRPEGSWKGWTAYSRAYAEKLGSQDWAGLYGLTPQELVLGIPLDPEGIRKYLELLPEGISEKRRAVITCALDSVGKIPYYYGGKATYPGLQRNQFASVTDPDWKGRILSGLDCSGWINWVYWTALGQPLGQQGTSGLIHAGRSISPNQLKPGDLMIRTGADSHVVMYLGRAADGSIIGIHESGSAGNVTIGKVSSDWPYYRAILD